MPGLSRPGADSRPVGPTLRLVNPALARNVRGRSGLGRRGTSESSKRRAMTTMTTVTVERRPRWIHPLLWRPGLLGGAAAGTSTRRADLSTAKCRLLHLTIPTPMAAPIRVVFVSMPLAVFAALTTMTSGFVGIAYQGIILSISRCLWQEAIMLLCKKQGEFRRQRPR